MEYKTPVFKKEMLKEWTVLIPNMAPVQFSILMKAMESIGYHPVLLQNQSENVSQLGLKYVHNDTCYPALLVIGQFLDALNSGKYDLDHTALIISQSGGGCRASNYIKLLRKALVKAGYGNIPVASLNASGLEKDSRMPMTWGFILKAVAAINYGDLIVSLYNQTRAYEVNKGEALKYQEKWVNKVGQWMKEGKYYLPWTLKKKFEEICEDFSGIELKKEKKPKVGIVGEIYVKFSPLGNNDLVDFLEKEDCEVNLPGLMGYLNYCVANWILDVDYYGGNAFTQFACKRLLAFFDKTGKDMSKAMEKYGFHGPISFKELMEKPKGILDLGTKMGEGWLLTAEMVELIEAGYPNIICAQPFGCLPNHIAGKGVINKIRSIYPEANITPVDYDPSATRVNQENRIKLMLAVARENL